MNPLVDEAAQLSSEYLIITHTYQNVPGAQYVLPNGATEHARLETQARHLNNMMKGKITHIPGGLEGAEAILDVGCGTGVVTEYLAAQCPNATVYGLDLTPVPDVGRPRPKNVRYLQGDILTQRPKEWRGLDPDAPLLDLHDTEGFGFIFSRLLICGLSNWDQFVRDGFRLLEPGGFMETQDLDWIWYDKSGKVISDDWGWFQRLRQATEARGLDLTCGSKQRSRMAQAGFVDIQVHEYYWPFGGDWEETPEMREFGEYVARFMVSMFWPLIPKTMQGASAADIEQMQRDMQRDFAPEDGKRWKFYVTVGRKPE